LKRTASRPCNGLPLESADFSSSGRTQRRWKIDAVFSRESKRSLISHAQSLGYQVVLYVVPVGDPQRLLRRVSQRVQEGGHNVSASRILECYPRIKTSISSALTGTPRVSNSQPVAVTSASSSIRMPMFQNCLGTPLAGRT
jgi:predicted ABC-type ATPase